MNDTTESADLKTSEVTSPAEGNEGPRASRTITPYHLNRLRKGSEHWEVKNKRRNRLNYQTTRFKVTLNTNAAQALWVEAFSPFCAALLRALLETETARLPEHKQAVVDCVSALCDTADGELDEVHAQVKAVIDAQYPGTLGVTYREALELEVDVSHPLQSRYLKLLQKVDSVCQVLDTAANLDVIEADRAVAQTRFVMRRVRGVKERTRYLHLLIARRNEQPVDAASIRSEFMPTTEPAEAVEAEADSSEAIQPSVAAALDDPWAGQE